MQTHPLRPTYDADSAKMYIEMARHFAIVHPGQISGQRDSQRLLNVTNPSSPLGILHMPGASYNVPPPNYGGSQNVLADLSMEMRTLGHHIGVFAPATSTIAGLIPTTPYPSKDGFTSQEGRALLLWLHFNDILRRLREEARQREQYHAIIGHAPVFLTGEILAQFDSHGILPLAIKHSLLIPNNRLTFGGSIAGLTASIGRDRYIYDYLQRIPQVALGERDREIAYAHYSRAWMVHAIPSGLSERSFLPLGRPLLPAIGTLGKITPNKGPADAIRLAKAAGKHSIIAGFIEDMAYFDSEVRPLLDFDLSEQPESVAALLDGSAPHFLSGEKPVSIFVGLLGGRNKDNFFSGIEAFLFPIHWEEPQGLVILEAWAAGTPVVAYRRGSVQALMAPHHGQWGFSIEEGDERAFKQAILDAVTLDRRQIQRWTHEEHHMRNTAQQYVDLIRYLCALWWMQGGSWFSKD